jgi:hypothetical protein
MNVRSVGVGDSIYDGAYLTLTLTLTQVLPLPFLRSTLLLRSSTSFLASTLTLHRMDLAVGESFLLLSYSLTLFTFMHFRR